METYVPAPYPGRLPSRLVKLYLDWVERNEKWGKDLSEEAHRAEKERLWEQYMYDSWCEGKAKAMKEQGYQSVRPTSPYYMVTVNADPETEVKPFVEKASKWVQQKHIQEAEYVFEQRSETVEEAGKGMHMHCILKTDTNKQDLIKRTYNTFKHFVGGNAAIDVRPVYDNYLEQKRQYIRGMKAGEKKQQRVFVDIYWRNINNLKDIYTTNINTNTNNGNDKEETYDQEEADNIC